ncbi:HAD family hydrolase [Streptomyces cinnamoneus]
MATQADPLDIVLGASKAILFDFDGPICDVFRGLPASGVAERLADLLTALTPALEPRARATDDPMEIHRLSQGGGGAVLEEIEAALTAAEVQAVKSAGAPTEGGFEALRAARYAGRRVAVVSNNSSDCVREYLTLHGLGGFVDEVVGRPLLRPDLMKPSPHPLLTAISALGVGPEAAVLVGDSVTDIEAAHAAGAMSVGYANKAPKEMLLLEAGAGVVVLRMQEIADSLNCNKRDLFSESGE